ncbi:hypothetical protein B0H11DRAFT_1925390 [Mycena galericulata]|nr:hypothetical protein B0H11DRAFT_1925390 [Mycena galericulata]
MSAEGRDVAVRMLRLSPAAELRGKATTKHWTDSYGRALVLYRPLLKIPDYVVAAEALAPSIGLRNHLYLTNWDRRSLARGECYTNFDFLYLDSKFAPPVKSRAYVVYDIGCQFGVDCQHDYGRTDGERVEQAWAEANPDQRPWKEMGAGKRWDIHSLDGIVRAKL